MTRIPQGFIQDLVARTDIVDVIGSRLDLKRAGKEYKALSPFTSEKSPSFFVSPGKQMFFCFSSGKSGNAVSFLMEYERLSFVEAVEELARRAGVEVPREGGGGPSRSELEGPLDALATAERIFRNHLRTHQPAIDYLKKRGVSGDTAKHFGIGYAPDSWDALSREFHDPAHALAAGLIKRKDEEGARGARIFDVFRDRIMFPIRDTRGRVIAFGGRTLGNDPAKYLNSPETVLFHKGRNLFGLYEAKQSSKSELPYLLVVEGYMDVVMLAQHGIHNAVATLGTATTGEHVTLLFKTTRRVVFCFDGDRAGRSAATRAFEQVLPDVNEGRECRFMFLPDGQDPDSLVQEIGAEAFRAQIDAAMTLSDFLIADLVKQADVRTLDGRARLAGLARPHLLRMQAGPLRTLIIAELARITRLGREDFEGMLNESPRSEAKPSKEPVRGVRREVTSARPIKLALQLLLDKPALAETVENVEQLAAAPQPGIDILIEAIDFFREHPNLSAAQLIEHWRGTAKGAALERVSMAALASNDESIDQEFKDSLEKLRHRALRLRADVLLEHARNRVLLPAELAELDEITRQLSSRNMV